MTENLYLPNEVLHHIFTFLSPQQLTTVGEVSRVWHAVAEDNALWGQLVEARFPGSCPKNLCTSGSAKQLFQDLRRLEPELQREWVCVARILRPVYSTGERGRARPDYFSDSIPTQVFSSAQPGEVQRLAIKHADGLAIYDPDTFKVVGGIEGPPPTGPMAFVGRRLFIGADGEIQRLAEGETESWLDIGSKILQLESVQGNHLLTLTDDGQVQLWDPSSKEMVGQLTGEGDRVEAVAVSHDGRFVALKYSHSRIDLRDLKTNSVQQIHSSENYYGTGQFNSSFGLFSDGNHVQLVQTLDRGMNGLRHSCYTAWPADEDPVETQVWHRGRRFVFQSATAFMGLPLMARTFLSGSGTWGTELCTRQAGEWTRNEVISFNEPMVNATLVSGEKGPLLAIAFEDRLELFRPQLSIFEDSPVDTSSDSTPPENQPDPSTGTPSSDSSVSTSSSSSDTKPPENQPDPPTGTPSSASVVPPARGSSSQSLQDVDRPITESRKRSRSFPWLLASAVALSALLGGALLLKRSRLI